MGRGGAQKERPDGPERKCIVTSERQPKFGLVRFVAGPDDTLVPDIAGKLPGRGMYLAADRDTFAEALKRNAFTRAARRSLAVPDGLVDEVERQISRRVVDLISLTRKSGRAVAGYEKVKDWLLREEAEVLIQAVDGSERGKTKLSTPHFGSYIGWLTADELGLAFGRQTVIHGALASGGLTRRVVEEAQRLKGLREFDGGTGHRKG